MRAYVSDRSTPVVVAHRRLARGAWAVVLIVLTAGWAAGCGSGQRTIRGTAIADTSANRQLLEQVDEYRRAVERGDVESLMLMAANEYDEDSGTATSSDDYGYEGLREVLATRFRVAKDVRYAIRTVAMRQQCPSDKFTAGCLARVEVIIDASYSVIDARGRERRADKRDQNELVFVWDGERWQILSGM